MVCLDSTFLIDLLRSKPGAREKYRELRERGNEATTTPLNAAELFEGAYASAKNKDEEVRKARELVKLIRILEFNVEASEKYGALSNILKSRGERIGDLDTLIASIALTHDETLITRNKEHFDRIQGLRVESY